MRFGLTSVDNVIKDIAYSIENNISHLEIDLTKIPIKKIEDVEKELRDCSKTISFHIPYDYTVNPQAKNSSAGLRYMESAVRLLERIEGEYIVMHLGYFEKGPRQKHLDNTINFLKKILKWNFDGIVAIENMKFKSQVSNKLFLGGETSDFDKVFNEIKDEKLKMCFDVGHAAYGWDINASFEHLKEKIHCLHIHDNDGIKDHLPVGKGKIDWKGFCKALRKFEIPGPAVFEIFDEPVHRSIKRLENMFFH